MSTPASHSGISAAIGSIGAGAPEASAERQLGLFGEAIADPDGVGAISDQTPARVGRRGPGRPPGARNRSTEQWRDFLLSRFTSPLVGMATLAQADPRELGRELGVAPAAALSIIQTAMRDLAPYLHSKQPQAIQLDGDGQLLTIVIERGEARESGSGGGGRLLDGAELVADAPKEIQQNQPLGESPDAMSENKCRNDGSSD